MSLTVSHFSASDARGGAAGAALRIHKGLCSLGVKSKLWVGRKEKEEAGVEVLRHRALWRRKVCILESKVDSVFLRNIPEHANDILSTGLFGNDLLPAVRADKPDIVQLHWIGGMYLRLASLAHVTQPIVWRLPDMWAFCGMEHYTTCDVRFREGYLKSNRPNGENGIDFNRWVWEHKRKIYSRIRNLTLVCPSQWLARCVAESRLLKDRETVVIKTGCDTQSYRPQDRVLARRMLNLPEDQHLVLVGADFLEQRRKGMDLFLEAVELLRRDRNCPPFAVGLFGRRSPELLARIAEPFHYFGAVDDALHLSLVYSAADTFVVPSRQENLANTLLEAMACGTPCVAFNVGGMPDAINHQQNGWLAKAFSIEDLADGIRWCLTNADQAALRNAARLTIETHFNQELQAQQFLQLYQRLSQG